MSFYTSRLCNGPYEYTLGWDNSYLEQELVDEFHCRKAHGSRHCPCNPIKARLRWRSDTQTHNNILADITRWWIRAQMSARIASLPQCLAVSTLFRNYSRCFVVRETHHSLVFFPPKWRRDKRREGSTINILFRYVVVRWLWNVELFPLQPEMSRKRNRKINNFGNRIIAWMHKWK